MTREMTESVAHAASALETRLASGWRPRAFVAIDFETANRTHRVPARQRRSRGGQRIAGKRVSLIRPPTSQFEFSHVHGITWAHVAAKRAFGEVWKTLDPNDRRRGVSRRPQRQVRSRRAGGLLPKRAARRFPASPSSARWRWLG